MKFRDIPDWKEAFLQLSISWFDDQYPGLENFNVYCWYWLIIGEAYETL